MSYQLTQAGDAVVEMETGTYIPLPASGEAGSRYLVWLTEGNTPALADLPIWSPAPTLRRLRDARELVLNRLAGIGFAAYAGGDTATVNACLAARLSLLAMTSLPAVAQAADEPALQAALAAAYIDIVAAAPPQLVGAFAQFNL